MIRKVLLLVTLYFLSINQALACEIDGTWKLQSEKTYFNIRFNQSGHASLSIGKIDDPYTAPIVNWFCENDVLKLVDHNGKLIKELTNIKRADNIITATNRDGRIETYQYIPPNI